MTQMVYRQGDMGKWKGVGYDYEIIAEEDLQEYLDAGWFAHPDDLVNFLEKSEPEPKRGRKSKAADNADSD